MKTLEHILGEQPFFKGLDLPYLNLIAGCSSNTVFRPEEFIFYAGEEANTFYIIRYGRVAIQACAPERGIVIIQSIGPGEALGWSWLFPPHRWRFDARALELTRAIALDGECLRKKCEEDPKLGYELMKRFAVIISKRLQATLVQLLDMYGVRS